MMLPRNIPTGKIKECHAKGTFDVHLLFAIGTTYGALASETQLF